MSKKSGKKSVTPRDESSEVKETIINIAKIHPEYSLKQFKEDFQDMHDREPTVSEKQAFQKYVIDFKTSSASPSIPLKVINGYTFGEVLGKGGFGEVYKCHKAGKDYAVKRIDESKSTANVEQSFAQYVSARLNSPFLVRYIDYFRGPSDELYVAMELCQKGDLKALIENLQKLHATLTHSRLMKIFIQLLLGLYTIHRSNILHRDLKSANVFVESEDNVKIGDFGCAKELDTTSQKADSVVGTPLYESPQVIKGEEYDSAADMWSLGVLLYELCTLERPFDHPNKYKLVELILAGKYSEIAKERAPPELIDIIRSLLVQDPRQRPSALALLRNPFVAKWGVQLGLQIHFPPETSVSAAAVVCSEPSSAFAFPAISFEPKTPPCGVRYVHPTTVSFDQQARWWTVRILPDIAMLWSLSTMLSNIYLLKVSSVHAILGLALSSGFPSLCHTWLWSRDDTCTIFSNSLFTGTSQACPISGWGPVLPKSPPVAVQLELNMIAHTLHIFVKGRQAPCCVTGVPADVCFAVGNSGFKNSGMVEVHSLQRIASTVTDLSVNCVKYPWKHENLRDNSGRK